MSDAGTRAIDLVRRAGIDHRVHRYELPEPHGRARKTRPAFGLRAAEALDVATDRIYKTLVVAVDDRLVLAVVPVAAELAVVVDSGSIEHSTIYVSAGRRGLQLELSPGDLARLAGALVAPIARDY